MTRVFLAYSQPTARAAMALLLRDLDMELVGEAADWQTALATAQATEPDLLVVDWAIIPAGFPAALPRLRERCPASLIVLLSPLGARQHAALGAGADAFISKSESPDRVAGHLRAAAARASAVRKPNSDPPI